MSRGHGTSRRQAYGRRMKDLRTRRGASPDIDLDGPSGWSRGDLWDADPTLPRPEAHLDQTRREARSR